MGCVRPVQEATVLDIGTGTGEMWKVNSVPEGWRITLTDLSKGMLEVAENNTRHLPNTLHFRVADAQSLPFDDNVFDIVIASHVFFHVPNIERALEEARRVLKPGRLFYVSTNGTAHMTELHHFIHEHFVSRLRPTAELPSIFGRFRLEHAAELVEKFFEKTTLTLYPGAYRVSDARLMIDFILSWGDWRDRLEGVGEDDIESVADEAAEMLARRIKNRPFEITKSVGLIEAC